MTGAGWIITSWGLGGKAALGSPLIFQRVKEKQNRRWAVPSLDALKTTTGAGWMITSWELRGRAALGSRLIFQTVKEKQNRRFLTAQSSGA
ncbi:MAG: hypothetical protein ACK5CA_04575 [Cyanobacteriota bacterium]|jgi:hypothetical protein